MGSNVRQCKKCGRIFVSYGTSMCPNCAQEMDRIFQLIKDYIYDHPSTNVIEISEKTGVEASVVLEFLKEDRLAIKTTEKLLVCESCGCSITSGRYCSKCLDELESALNSARRELTPKLVGKMHFNSRK